MIASDIVGWDARCCQFGHGRLQRPAQHDFGNQVGRVMANYLTSDHFAVLFVATIFTNPTV